MSTQRHWDLMMCGALAVGLVAGAGIDLDISGIFYRSGDGFFLKNAAWVRGIHHGVPILSMVVVVILLGLLGLGYHAAFAHLGRYRRPAAYLLLTLILGPGLVVNSVFKSHWGRARPTDVMEFGGAKSFSSPLLISDQCDRNCSFVCGHASLGFALCAFGFLTRKRWWFVTAVGVGGVLGVARIVQGKHFFSDVVFSFITVYFCAKFLYFVMYECEWRFRRTRFPVLVES